MHINRQIQTMSTKHHHHLLLRHTPLRVRSATSRQQPPEWSVLSQVDCFSPCEFVGVQVIFNRIHPGNTRSPKCLFQSTGGYEVRICNQPSQDGWAANSTKSQLSKYPAFARRATRGNWNCNNLQLNVFTRKFQAVERVCSLFWGTRM